MESAHGKGKKKRATERKKKKKKKNQDAERSGATLNGQPGKKRAPGLGATFYDAILGT